MIFSVSQRTDIPAYYSEWLMKRLKAGFVDVANPFNPHLISRIDLHPQVIDCMMLLTKNPIPMMRYLDELDFPYFFHITLTGFGREIEPHVPDKQNVLIPAIQQLAKKIGRHRIIWRYDPIFINERYSIAYHAHAFETICKALKDSVHEVIISFVDMYEKVERRSEKWQIRAMSFTQIHELSEKLGKIAHSYGLRISTCCEGIDLSLYGIQKAICIDQKYIEQLIGYEIEAKPWNQREHCDCISVVDIGSYDTCLHGCRYCYANHEDERVLKKVRGYDSDSTILCGKITPQDKIVERRMKSLRKQQASLFNWME